MSVVCPTTFVEDVFKTSAISPRKVKIITANTPLKLPREPMPLVPLVHGLTSEPKYKINNQLYKTFIYDVKRVITKIGIYKYGYLIQKHV